MMDPASVPFKSGHVVVQGGVRLNYFEAGDGMPLVMLPGWSQAAIQFDHQLAGLSSRYRVIALDPRGHGESDKPDHGYRLPRMAMDLREMLDALDLNDVTLLGHSLGAAQLWCYWDLFGAYRTARFIFVDQPPVVTTTPYASESSWDSLAALLAPEDLQKTVQGLSGPDGVETTRSMLSGMVSPKMPKDEFEWMVAMSLRMPRRYAARLLYNGALSDWRDTIPRIDRPTLIVSGRGSHVPWQTQVWIHEQISGSRIGFVEAEEDGHHFMFMENPEKFNLLVADYLG